MEQLPRQQYTKEFREQAVQLVLAQQVPIAEAARLPEHVRQNAEELGGASPARPARHAGGEPTTRDGAGGGAVPTHTRACRSTDGARHLKKSPAYVAKAQLPGTR